MTSDRPHVIITAGPTYEPLDQVRRLTNHSTGRLGIGLANFLTRIGIQVTLLKGYYCTYEGKADAQKVVPFTTTESLAAQLRDLSSQSADAVFHAAAVSDFRFGKIVPLNQDTNEPAPIEAVGKWSTQSGSLMAELIPTRKILQELRPSYPDSLIVGWKYEVDGDAQSAIEKSRSQLNKNETDLSVVNGPAYGDGFGVLDRSDSLTHCESHEKLFQSLASHLQQHLDARAAAAAD